jgi:hypothetical protein
MKIHFERSGGFLGRELSTSVDTNELAAREGAAVVGSAGGRRLLHPAGDRRPSGPESLPATDHLCYRVTVEVAGVQHTVETSDVGTPPRLEPLIDELSRWARQSERSSDGPGSDF